MNDVAQSADLHPLQVAHYRLVTKLGQGGMGEVFLAIDTKLDRRVALKLVYAEDPTSIVAQRFEREAKSAAALDHPNILAIHDYGREDDKVYVVMELLEGQNLRELLLDAVPPLGRALSIACDICDGLVAAHSRRILHRDLKPENVFVTRSGLVKILDFGLAKKDTGATLERLTSGKGDEEVTETQLTSAGTVLGTAGYMSPEQIRGKRVSLQSDIFSFGSLLYETLTGERAFREQSAIETMHAVLREEPSEAPLVDRKTPIGVRQIIGRCLRKEADDRYDDTRDLALGLRAQLELLASNESTRSLPRVASGVDELLERVAENSIAVLPFVNTSSDPETEYFSDGMTEEVISVLSQLRGLRVAARTSSFVFKNKALRVQEIGQQLNVETILEGSVRRVGNRVRVTAQLVKVADGYQMWSNRYDRELDDVFSIQENIAGKIAESLEVSLSRSSGLPVVRHATRNVEAYDLFLRGRHLIEERGDGLPRGLEVLQRSIELDPDFAPAYAAIAEAWILLAVYEAVSPQESMPKAKKMAEMAVGLDDGLPEGHNCMAMILLMWDWDWDGARDAFHRALNLNPSFVPAMYWYGLLYRMLVRGDSSEALVFTVRATVLDPLAVLPVYNLGLVLVCSGRYEEAVERLQEGLKRDPGTFVLYRALGAAYLGLEENEKAVISYEKALASSGRHPWAVADYGVALAKVGRRDEARLLQNELSARSESSYTSSTMQAQIPTALGDFDVALDLLERGVRNRDTLALSIRNWPSLAALQGEPRLHALLEQMKFPPIVEP